LGYLIRGNLRRGGQRHCRRIIDGFALRAGVGCRLLDVQELLSDTGLGRQMHVIVGQGQLDAVLSATPEDRRGFIEEAAGVLKHLVATGFEAGGGQVVVEVTTRSMTAAQRLEGLASALAFAREYLEGGEPAHIPEPTRKRYRRT